MKRKVKVAERPKVAKGFYIVIEFKEDDAEAPRAFGPFESAAQAKSQGLDEAMVYIDTEIHAIEACYLLEIKEVGLVAPRVNWKPAGK